MYVQGPNGVVIEVSGALATGLVGNGKRGYRFVAGPSAPEPTEVPSEPAVTPKRKPRARKKTGDG